MKTIYSLIGAIIILIALFYGINAKEKQKDTFNMPVQIIPISHATAVIKWGDTTIYTDPVGGGTAFKNQPPADIILITDIHGDHFSTSTLSAVIGNAVLIVPQAVKEQLPDALASRASVLKNGEIISEKTLQILAMPMYNLPESSDGRHTKGRGNGYVIERDGFRVYVAGDTAGIPEMRALKDIDIALVPMNLPYTMGVDEAADAVLDFKPKKVYPYHYRGQDGLSDVNKFKELVNTKNPNIEVILMNWYPQQ